jgi:catechol 2,3-dioxygenase-like lactoylglutathione lyase family enzyme
MSFLRIDHVQIAVPRGRERDARRFYEGILGLREVARPRHAAAGSIRYDLGDCAQLHVVLLENPFRPPLGDHFAVIVDDLQELKRRLAAFAIEYSGEERIFISDPFGNRMEFVERNGAGVPAAEPGW